PPNTKRAPPVARLRAARLVTTRCFMDHDHEDRRPRYDCAEAHARRWTWVRAAVQTPRVARRFSGPAQTASDAELGSHLDRTWSRHSNPSWGGPTGAATERTCEGQPAPPE